MSFIYPSFLFALCLIAVPIIIHLFNFRRYKTVYFTNVKFLKEIKQETSSINQLKHLLVLACRILAIAFLVLAFAQPYFPSANSKLSTGYKDVSIYIDNSFSMGLEQKKMPLLELAKQKAIEIVKGYSDADRFQILTSAFEGKHQRLVSKQEALDMIAEIQIGSDVQNIKDVIARQKQVMQNATGGDKIFYEISDFQKNTLNDFSLAKDSSEQIFVLPLRNSNAANLSIDSVWFSEPVQYLNQTVHLYTSITNHSSDDVSDNRISLELNNVTKAISNFSVAAGKSVVDTLEFTTSSEGWNHADVSLTDFPVTFDDQFYFSFKVDPYKNIMIINDQSENQYLNSVFTEAYHFKTSNINSLQIDYSEIAKQDFVVLNSLKQISSGLAESIQRFISNGGNVLLIPAINFDQGQYNILLSSLNANQIQKWEQKEKHVSEINLQHKLLKNVFIKTPQNILLPSTTSDFTFASIVKTNFQNILSFGDGSFLLASSEIGNGNLYISAVPFDKQYSDLVTNTLFAPLMFRMATLKNNAPPVSVIIGSNQNISVPFKINSDADLVHMKLNNYEFIPNQKTISGSQIISVNNQAQVSGNYLLYQPSIDSAWIGLNYNRKESDLNFATDQELKNAFANFNFSLINNTDRNLSSMINEIQLGVVLWKYCIIFVLIFMGIETLLLKFWK